MKYFQSRKKSWLMKAGGAVLALVLVFTQLFSGSVAAASILNETFGNTNNTSVSGWNESDPAEILGSSSGADASKTGSSSDKFAKIGAEMQGSQNSQSVKNGWICKEINASGYNALNLSYYWKGDSDADSLDKGVVEYRTSGNCNSNGGWTTIDTENLNSNTGSWSSVESHSLSLSNQSFLLRFRNAVTKANGSDNVADEYFRVDGVSIEGTLIPDMCSNIQGLQETVPAGKVVDGQGNCVTAPATISATKVVCDAEQYLPNWGNSGANITASSAQNWVTQSAGKCHLQGGWSFQFANDGVQKPNNNALSAGAGWTTFGVTNVSGVATTTIPAGASVWVREQLQSGFAAFSGAMSNLASSASNTSAEMYCGSDVLNYDNYDKITSAQSGTTYHCVAFNAPADACQNIAGTQLNPPAGYIIKHQGDQSQCVPEFVDVTLCKVDDAQKPLSNWDLHLDSDTLHLSQKTDGTGCTTFNDVPYGNYNTSEVMQANWTQLSQPNLDGNIQAYGQENSTYYFVNKYTPPAGSIQITKYSCSGDFTPNRNDNGVGDAVPENCVPKSGVSFGYVHGTQTDPNAPHPELNETPVDGGATGGNGVLTISGLSSTGRYLVKETDASNLLALYCEGDGDTNPNNNDNQEITFVPAGGVAKCVAYNKAPVQQPTTATISAKKIVCDSEDDLPNWGAGGPSVTASTAANFLTTDFTKDAKQDCHLADWDFKWNLVDGPSTIFSTTALNGGTATIPTGTVWVSEVINENYIPFTGENTTESVSAEMYCDTDVLHYDNAEYINAEAGQTYHCVAFNVLKTVAPTTLKVHIYKYLKNGNTTAQVPDVSTAPSFPMASSWSAVSHPAGSGTYVLGNNEGSTALRYAADTSAMSVPANYSTNEVTDGSVVVPADSQSCPAGKYRLVGYKVGDSLAAAELAAPTTTSPAFVGLTADKYVIVVNEACGEQPPVLSCTPGVDLLANGGFETPDVGTGGYGIFPTGTVGLGWLVEWMAEQTGTAGLEIQDNVAGAPAMGLQHAELDGDHPVKIWQDIPTIPGKEYKLTFKYSPRPGSESGTNKIEARANGSVLGAMLSGAGGGITNWASETRTFTADNSGTTKIEFADVDTDNSYGGYLDDVALTCVGDPKAPCEEAPKHIVDDFGVSCESADDQTCNTGHDKQVTFTENAVINASYIVPGGHCSSVQVEAYLDGQLITTTPFMGYTGDPENRPMSAALFTNKAVTAGTHTITLKAIGVEGGCNAGVLGSWGGTLDISTQNSCEVVPPVCEYPEVYNVETKKCEAPVVDTTSDVTLCKIDDDGVKLPGWTLMLLDGAKIETVQVPSTNSNGVLSTSLNGETSYVAVASGQWTNQGGANVVDAEYSSTDAWATQMDGYTGYQTDILELQINDVFDPASWGPYNSLHTYAQAFTQAVTGPAKLRIFDGSGTTQNESWFGDNSGTLSVDLYKGYSGVTGQNGCVTIPNVPFGSYTVSEVNKANWFPVNPNPVVPVNQLTQTITVENHFDFCPAVGVQSDPEDCPAAPQETTSSGTTVVTPSNMQGWAFVQETATGSGQMVVGPTGSLNTGSAQLIVDSAGGELFGAPYVGTKFSDIKGLSYNTYRVAGAVALAPSVQLNIDTDVTDANVGWQGRLVYEPYYTQTVNDGVWQTWNALNDAAGTGTGNWWFSNGTIATNTGCTQANPCTWAEVKTALPNGGIHGTLGGVGFKAGSNWAGGFTGNVDNFVLAVKSGLDTHTETYDFEPASQEPETPVTQCSDGKDNDGDKKVDMDDEDCDSPSDDNEDDDGGSNSSSGSIPQGRVAGAFIGPSVLGDNMCGEYITDYIKWGAKNDEANVSRLQVFLNEYLGLKLEVNGKYDQATYDAVKQFQLKEGGEVLDPWVGVTLKDKIATGWVYKTTKRWINMIKCPELNIPKFTKNQLF